MCDSEEEYRSCNSKGEEEGEMTTSRGEDILSALEKIPGVGSLRSVRIASSGSLLSCSERNTTTTSSLSKREEDEVGKSPTNSCAKSSLPSSSLSSGSEKTPTYMNPRPLPRLPSVEPKTEEISLSLVSKRGDNEEEIYDSLLTTSEDGYCELNSPPSLPGGRPTNGSGYYLTMTGTVRRGRKNKDEDVNIHLDATATEHLSLIERRVTLKHHDRCFCGLRRGIHVFMLSLLSLPFIWIVKTLQAFFLGTMTWYNIFIHYNEERTCCHTLLSPLVLLAYPFWICPVTVFLGLWGGLIQLSWYLDSWLQELRNPDSGFFSWFCNKIVDLPDCAPYQVVVLPPMDSSSCGNKLQPSSV